MKEIELIKWLQNLNSNPREAYRGETGFMFHEIIERLWHLKALERILKAKNIRITLKEISKNLYKT